ncbi:carbonic anhydrase [Paenibacillus elgii]|uniref:carbonic anhydrase n=1 Tax=Paenibacillus elgii TaxID=189691 RepID=UPI0013D058C8|nr:carbonic anhydrase [Paenibacillus elgii]
MNSVESKKALFVIGMEDNMEHILQQAVNIHPDNMLILQIDEPVISQHFSDVMRDIVIAVYEENVKEIFVVGEKDDSVSKAERQELLKKLYENKELKEKLRTINYLFEHCTPEFPGIKFSEWLESSKTSTEGIQKSVNMIRQHPLMPSHVQVHGLLIDRLSGKVSEIKFH